MPFEMGNKLGAGKGRPKGSQNKETREVRELLQSNRVDLVQRALDLVLVPDLKETNTVILNKLLDKLVPTLKATEFSGTLTDHRPDFSELSTEELEEVIAKLTAGETLC